MNATTEQIEAKVQQVVRSYCTDFATAGSSNPDPSDADRTFDIPAIVTAVLADDSMTSVSTCENEFGDTFETIHVLHADKIEALMNAHCKGFGWMRETA